MKQSLLTKGLVTTKKTNAKATSSSTRLPQNAYFDMLDDDDDDDFIAAPLSDIDFEELDFQDEKEFRYEDEDDDLDIDNDLDIDEEE